MKKLLVSLFLAIAIVFIVPATFVPVVTVHNATSTITMTMPTSPAPAHSAEFAMCGMEVSLGVKPAADAMAYRGSLLEECCEQWGMDGCCVMWHWLDDNGW